MAGTDDLLSTFDVDDMATEALLFQTGYLTIRDHRRLGGRTVYRLGYPNQEVRQSLNDSLSRYLAGDPTRQMANSIRLHELLEANDFAGLKTLFHAFYASIPHQWYTNNDIAHFEGYYASVFYSYFAGLGLDVTVEDSTSHGRLDMAVCFNGNVYLFEFKVVGAGACGRSDGAVEGGGATRTSTGTWGSRSTWSRWSSARSPATWWRSRWNVRREPQSFTKSPRG